MIYISESGTKSLLGKIVGVYKVGYKSTATGKNIQRTNADAHFALSLLGEKLNKNKRCVSTVHTELRREGLHYQIEFACFDPPHGRGDASLRILVNILGTRYWHEDGPSHHREPVLQEGGGPELRSQGRYSGLY